MKKIILSIIICIVSSICIWADEPGNNLGKSYQYVKSNDPAIRYIRTNGNRTVYGAETEGISTFYTFEDDMVVEECLMVESNNGFARDWYYAVLESFQKTQYRKVYKTSNGYTFKYTYFDVKITYHADYSGYTTMVLYTTDFTY